MANAYKYAGPKKTQNCIGPDPSGPGAPQDKLAPHGWNVEQILVYIWQCISGEYSEQEYPYSRFANSEMGKRLRVELERFPVCPAREPGASERRFVPDKENE